MTTNVDKKIRLPKHGFIKELAKLAGCDRRTVHRALYNNARGPKSERVRILFRDKYENR
jgi:hypothetical protein